MSAFDLTGRRVLVTGGAQGLGEGMARALTAAGARVMLGDLQADRAATVASELGAGNGSVHLDVTSEESWAAAIDATVAQLGGLDVVVNNAGVEITGLLTEISVDDVRRQLDVNVLGTALGLKHGLRALRPGGAAGGGGAIINVASVAATIAFPGIAIYSATKSAIDRMTRVAAMEAGKLGYGVRVNCIYPGLVPTEMGTGLAVDMANIGLFGSPEEAVEAVVGLTPSGRLGEVQDMADAVVFLASDASRFVNGAGLPVDGGMGMGRKHPQDKENHEQQAGSGVRGLGVHGTPHLRVPARVQRALHRGGPRRGQADRVDGEERRGHRDRRLRGRAGRSRRRLPHRALPRQLRRAEHGGAVHQVRRHGGPGQLERRCALQRHQRGAGLDDPLRRHVPSAVRGRRPAAGARYRAHVHHGRDRGPDRSGDTGSRHPRYRGLLGRQPHHRVHPHDPRERRGRRRLLPGAERVHVVRPDAGAGPARGARAARAGTVAAVGRHLSPGVVQARSPRRELQGAGRRLQRRADEQRAGDRGRRAGGHEGHVARGPRRRARRRRRAGDEFDAAAREPACEQVARLGPRLGPAGPLARGDPRQQQLQADGPAAGLRRVLAAAAAAAARRPGVGLPGLRAPRTRGRAADVRPHLRADRHGAPMTVRDLPEVPALPETRAARAPQDPAVADDRLDLSNAEFAAAVRTAATRLAEFGVERGDVVGLLLPNRVELVVAVFAAWRLGAAVTPINPALAPPEIAYQAADASARVLVTESGAQTPDGVAAIACHELLAESDDEAAAPEPVSTGDLALLIYTAGTTGKPKGVMITHGNIAAMTASFIEHFAFTERDHSLLVLPLFHANGVVLGTLTPLRAGGRTTIVGRFRPDEFFPAVERHRPTYFSAVPAIYAMLTALPEEVRPDSSSLRFGICGAAPMPVDLIERFESRFGVPIVEGYGLSETTTASAINPLDGPRKPGTVGPALPGQRIRIVDGALRDVPRGETGEVLIAGKVVMAGYLNRPDATAETIVDGWLRTGDVGLLDEDGYLRLVDRVKDMVIRGGENIYPKEIEAQLYRNPQVFEAAVIGRPHDVLGEVPVAYVSLRAGATVTAAELLDGLRGELAKVKVPVDLILLDEVPKNPVGKIDKPTLRQRDRA